MKQAPLAAMTVAELKALAKKKKIVLPPGAKKADLIKALSGKTTAAAAKRKKAAPKKAAKNTPAKRAGAKTAAKKAAPVKGKAAAVIVPKKSARPPVRPAAPREWRAALGGSVADQERIAGAKYFTGPGRGETVTPSLPSSYGDERIVIMPRDPFVLFGYWEVPRERIERERARLGSGSRLCVRIYDITGVSFDGSNATATFDQEVYERTGSWYFHLARPAHRFCADIGLLASDGRFLTLNRSNRVSMPRETVSDHEDNAWMISDEDFLRLHGLGRGIGGVSSAQMHEALRAARLHEISSHGLFSRQARAQKRK